MLRRSLVPLVLVLGAACVSKTSDERCPSEFRPQPELDAKLIELLSVDPHVAETERATRKSRVICHGPIDEGALTPDQVILLPADDSPPTAARLAHLLAHLEAGFGQLGEAARPNCVERALDHEAAAWRIELELRAHYDVEPMAEFELGLRRRHVGVWPFAIRDWLERDQAPSWSRAHYEARCGGPHG